MDHSRHTWDTLGSLGFINWPAEIGLERADEDVAFRQLFFRRLEAVRQPIRLIDDSLSAAAKSLAAAPLRINQEDD